MAERRFKVVDIDTGEICAVFGDDQCHLAVTLADSLAAQGNGRRYAVVEETLVHETWTARN
jgi:hypothetical protein